VGNADRCDSGIASGLACFDSLESLRRRHRYIQRTNQVLAGWQASDFIAAVPLTGGSRLEERLSASGGSKSRLHLDVGGRAAVGAEDSTGYAGCAPEHDLNVRYLRICREIDRGPDIKRQPQVLSGEFPARITGFGCHHPISAFCELRKREGAAPVCLRCKGLQPNFLIIDSLVIDSPQSYCGIPDELSVRSDYMAGNAPDVYVGWGLHLRARASDRQESDDDTKRPVHRWRIVIGSDPFTTTAMGIMSRMRGIAAVVVVALALAAAVVPIDSRLVERWYSTWVFPSIQHVLTPVSNLVPFALLDVLAAGGLCGVLFVSVRSVLLARRKKRWQPIVTTLARLVTSSALVYLLFLALWGLNYRRVAMADRLVLERNSGSGREISELGRTSVKHLNALYAAAHQEGWRISPWREHRLRNAFEAVLLRLSDATPAVPGRMKSSLLGPYFRWTSVDGMINPFGLEAIANPDLLPFEQPFVAAHEWAHLAGYADESEASFVGFLTCIGAATPAAYSGWLFLYWQINSEVGTAERKQLSAELQDGPRRDIAAVAARLRRGEVPVLRDAGWRVYDQYLKANRIEEGVRSYSLVLTLLTRTQFKDGWTPIRREARAP
jgi:hypothetical protein